MVRRDELGADPAEDTVEGDGLGGCEERLPRRHRADRVGPIGGRTHDRARPAPVASDRDDEGVGQPADGDGRVGQGHDADEDVAVGRLDRETRVEQVPLDRVAVGAGGRQHQRELERVDAGAVQHDETGDAGQPGPRGAGGLDGRRQQRLPVALEEGPGRVDAGEDRARGARGRRGLDPGVEPGLVDPVGARTGSGVNLGVTRGPGAAGRGQHGQHDGQHTADHHPTGNGPGRDLDS